MLGKGEIIAITLAVLGLEFPMFMEIQNHPSTKPTSLLLGTGNMIHANIQPTITKHEVFLVGVCSGTVAMSGCLCCGQQCLLEQRLVVGVARRPMMGPHVGHVTVMGFVLWTMAQWRQLSPCNGRRKKTRALPLRPWPRLAFDQTSHLRRAGWQRLWPGGP
jgi:hypothetical protein